jgi:hypothetical protein
VVARLHRGSFAVPVEHQRNRGPAHLHKGAPGVVLLGTIGRRVERRDLDVVAVKSRLAGQLRDAPHVLALLDPGPPLLHEHTVAQHADLNVGIHGARRDHPQVDAVTCATAWNVSGF